MDIAGVGGVDRAVRQATQPQGPTELDIVQQSIAYVNALKAQIEAQQKNGEPFQGMY